MIYVIYQQEAKDEMHDYSELAIISRVILYEQKIM
jgi:hypothetical protein